MRNVVIALSILAVYVQAQFTKVFEEPVSTVSNIYAYDAEHLNDIYSPYVGFQTGSIVSILNLNTLTIEYTADVSAIQSAMAEKSYFSVTFYKNLFQSDGKWTALVYSPNLSSYNVSIFSEGKLISTSILSATTFGFPSLRLAGGNIYMVTNTGTSIEVYLVRNDVPSSLAIWDNSKYMTALKNIEKKADESRHFNALGQQIPDIQYEKLQDFLKKSYYNKK